MLQRLLALMAELKDQQRITAPWIEWGAKHKVVAHFSEFAPDDTAYVLSGSCVAIGSAWRDAEYVVVVSHGFVNAALAAINAPRDGVPPVFGVKPQELVTMIAWSKANLSDR